MAFWASFHCKSCQNMFWASASPPEQSQSSNGEIFNSFRLRGDTQIHCKNCMDRKSKTSKRSCISASKISKMHVMNFERKEREITIVTQDGSNLYADVLVLSNRSEVFEKMFEAEMMEKNTRKVTIDDVKTETVKDFLFFLYQGELREVPSGDNVKELLQLAHRFDIKELVYMLDIVIHTELVKCPCSLELLKMGFMYGLPKTKEFLRENATQEIVDKVGASLGGDYQWYAEFYKTVLASPNISWKPY